jgi:DNA invertase Pin-like site-specific DNA recombinase
MDKYTCFYARTSTLTQGTGLESQIRALEAYAKANGITAFRLFTDEVSGRKESRPGLDAMLAEVRAGNVSQVVVYSLSRFSRSVKHLLESLDALNCLDVSFISLTESLNTATPTGRAVITIISAIAQLESDLVKERVRNGLVNARAKGIRLGAPAKHTDKAQVIHLLASQDMSHRKIASMVGASQSTVSRILKKTDSKIGA